MPVLKNPKYEKYVQCRIAGLSQRKAYLEAFPNSRRWKERTVDSRASELEKQSDILGRMQELQEKSVSKAVMTRTERMELLTNIAKDEEERTDNRMKAVDYLNKMSGEYTEKIDMSVKASEKFADIVGQLGGGLDE